MRPRHGSVLLALAVIAGPAGGIEDPLPGGVLSMRQGRLTSRLVLVAHTAVVAPLPGSSEDPTVRGASLAIGNPRSGEWAELAAPASGWSMNPLGTVFRYHAPKRGAAPGIRSLVIRHARRLKVKASAVGITLDEPTQGIVAAVLTTGTRRYCMVFGGDVRRDQRGKFTARDAPAPAACPAPAEGTITTTTTSSTLRQPGKPTTSTTRTDAVPSTSSTAPPATSTTRPTASSTSTSSTSSSTRTTTSTSSSTTSTRPKKPKHDEDER